MSIERRTATEGVELREEGVPLSPYTPSVLSWAVHSFLRTVRNAYEEPDRSQDTFRPSLFIVEPPPPEPPREIFLTPEPERPFFWHPGGNFEGADLTKGKLVSAVLSKANLTRANLSGTNLADEDPVCPGDVLGAGVDVGAGDVAVIVA